MVSPVKVRAEEVEIRQRANDVIDFLQLERVADERAGNLSGGQKKLLELGRTMMVDAKIVFLDEVGAGVNRTLLKTIGDAIQRLNRERGYTFCYDRTRYGFYRPPVRPGDRYGRRCGADTRHCR